MDAQKILNKVNSRENKERFTFTVDASLLQTFKNLCGKRALSPVIEELMREFIESMQSPPPQTETKALAGFNLNNLIPEQRNMVLGLIQNLAAGAFDQDEINEIAALIRPVGKNRKIQVKSPRKPSSKQKSGT